MRTLLLTSSKVYMDCILWLIRACTYNIWCQETMRLIKDACLYNTQLLSLHGTMTSEASAVSKVYESDTSGKYWQKSLCTTEVAASTDSKVSAHDRSSLHVLPTCILECNFLFRWWSVPVSWPSSNACTVHMASSTLCNIHAVCEKIALLFIWCDFRIVIDSNTLLLSSMASNSDVTCK